MEKTIDVTGIGNALVDFLVEVSDEEFNTFNLNKGQFNLVDEHNSRNMLEKLKAKEITFACGGSSANTIGTLGKLGARTSFIGKVGNDEHGDFFNNEMSNTCIKTKITRGPGITGHVISFITPDTERTMSVHLGESIKMTKDDISEEDVNESKFFHVEGYQLEDPVLRETVAHAMDIAKKNNTIISMDLGDPGVIERNLREMKGIVKIYANILFLNEDEAKVFTGIEDPELALEKVSNMVDVAVVKLGKNGSLIKKQEEIIKINPVLANAVDTTGAGDNYAAGFLYGLSKGYSLKICGDMASTIAAKIVERVGARFEEDPREYIKHLEQINQV